MLLLRRLRRRGRPVATSARPLPRAGLRETARRPSQCFPSVSSTRHATRLAAAWRLRVNAARSALAGEPHPPGAATPAGPGTQWGCGYRHGLEARSRLGAAWASWGPHGPPRGAHACVQECAGLWAHSRMEPGAQAGSLEEGAPWLVWEGVERDQVQTAGGHPRRGGRPRTAGKSGGAGHTRRGDGRAGTGAQDSAPPVPCRALVALEPRARGA